MKKINEISYNSIFILFLMISTNYVSEILPKSIIRLISNNLLIKHILSFLVLFLFILVVHPEKKFLSYIEIILSGLIIYLIFFIMCISKGVYFIINVVICFILYIIHLKENTITDINIIENKTIQNEEINNYKISNTAKRKKIINIIKKILIVLLYIITIIGIIHNFYDKKIRFKNNFNIWKFIFYLK